jgi:hypothetical protein
MASVNGSSPTNISANSLLASSLLNSNTVNPSNILFVNVVEQFLLIMNNFMDRFEKPIKTWLGKPTELTNVRDIESFQACRRDISKIIQVFNELQLALTDNKPLLAVATSVKEKFRALELASSESKLFEKVNQIPSDTPINKRKRFIFYAFRMLFYFENVSSCSTYSRIKSFYTNKSGIARKEIGITAFKQLAFNYLIKEPQGMPLEQIMKLIDKDPAFKQAVQEIIAYTHSIIGLETRKKLEDPRLKPPMGTKGGRRSRKVSKRNKKTRKTHRK